ncbi:VPLPA-CTERM sorting domain-containing protein [Dongia sp. agr-C8]
MRCTASRAMLAAGLLAAAAILPLGGADAAPVQFGNSYYEYITDEAISWSDASAAAGASIFMGVNGHLATVTSSAENDFLLGIAPSISFPQAVWLGGAVDAGGTARWAVGPEAGQLFTFSNFGGAEPDDGPSNVYMNIGPAIAGILTGQWGDAAGGASGGSSSGGSSSIGYFVEYQVGTVPLPAALPLMLTGLAGFGVLGWRRKRALRTVAAD